MKPKWLQVLRPKRSSRSPSPTGGPRQDTSSRPGPSPPQPTQSGPSVSTPTIVAPGPPAPLATPATDDQIRTRIWNSAYDKAKEDEPRLVEAYEKILSVQLSQDIASPLPDGDAVNLIKQDADARQAQMKQLIDKGLEKTEREAKIKEKIKEGMQPIKNVKDFVAMAVKAEPTAAVAWVGITTCMEIITNPVTEPGINRDGIKYVLERVQWYWELADLLLGADRTDDSAIKLQGLLEKNIVSLYKKLFLYQMQSVCLYNKRWAAVIVRDLFKADDWQEKVDSIKKAETSIRQDVDQHNSEVLKSSLLRIDGTLEYLRLDVQAVASAVGEVESAVNEQTRGLLKMHYDEKDNECLKDLHIVNPQTHKQRLEKTKGGLLKDSYRWILDHDDFIQFRSDPDRRLLWIKGDPGKGKTMLLCGIIDELEKESAHSLSYFFCQATQDHLRSAISVLRGLLWLLCKRQPTLMSCVRVTYDMEGKKCFDDFFTLKGMLENMLQQRCLQTAVLIVDALDECSYQGRHDFVEREELIDLIIELSASFGAKWIVSSRNWPVIEGQLHAADKITVPLELNKDSISRAVETFVRFKTNELARSKPYDEKTKEAVLQRLLVGANDTFLWVALMCKELARPVVKPWETLAKLDHLRTGLDDLYNRMLEQIFTSDYSALCRQILATACVAYRPLSLNELRTLVPKLQDFGPEALTDIIGECGSFLALQEDVIYFVHQSAQDFLVGKGQDTIFPSGIPGQHRLLFINSLEALKILRRDIYSLKSPGILVKDITPPDPDPLSSLKYAIAYWIDHLGQLQGKQSTSDDEVVDKFFRKKYLYWLEALILQHLMEQVPDKIQRLRGMIHNSKVKDLKDLVKDARRFVLACLEVIVEAPLQLYASALVFSPTSSAIRQLFEHEEPSWLAMKPRAEPSWSACVLRVERPYGSGSLHMAISPDGKLLAHLIDSNLQIFNVGWRHYTHSVKADDWAQMVSFAPNGEQLAVGSKKGPIKLIDTRTGQIREFMGHKGETNALAFSPDGKLLASASSSMMVLWDVSTGRPTQTLNYPDPFRGVYSRSFVPFGVSFSADGQQLALGGIRKIIAWDVGTGDCTWSIEAHDRKIESLAFLSENLLVSGSQDHTVKVWDLTERACTLKIETQTSQPSVVSLQAGGRFAYLDGSPIAGVNISNERGECLQTISLHMRTESLAFLPGPQLLATTSMEELRLWDLESKQPEQVAQDENGKFSELALSWDGHYLASGSQVYGKVRLWDTSAGTYEQILDHGPMDQGILELIFSENGQLLIAWSVSYERGYSLFVWDTANGKSLGIYVYESGQEATLSPDGQQLALVSAEKTITVWDLHTGKKMWGLHTANCIHKIKPDTWIRPRLVDNGQLVLAFDDVIELWDILQTRCTFSLRSERLADGYAKSIALSNDSELFAVSGDHKLQVWNAATASRLHELNVSASKFTISSDKKWMVYDDRGSFSVGILNMKTGTYKPHIKLPCDTRSRPWRLDPHDDSRLYTKCGVMDLTNSLHSDTDSDDFRPRYFGYGLDGGGDWIIHGSTRILWLPPEYRSNVAVMGSTVAVRHEESGRDSVIRFVEDIQWED